MLQYVYFNTEKKAKRCFQMLGKRGAFYTEIIYCNKSYGFNVYYFTKQKIIRCRNAPSFL